MLNRILCTKDMLYKFKKVQSPLCYLCQADIETLEHFLFCCPQVEVFWKEIVSLFEDNLKITTGKCFEITDIFFGINKQDTYALLLNYIILECKYILCKLNNKPLSPILLLERIKNTYKIELFIAREKNKLNYPYEKWKPLIPLIISGQETWAVRTSGTGNFSVRTRKNVIPVVRMDD